MTAAPVPWSRFWAVLLTALTLAALAAGAVLAAVSLGAKAGPEKSVRAIPSRLGFWAADSFLHVQVPDRALVDANSASWTGQLFNLAWAGLGVNYEYWTAPIYRANRLTPTATVRIANSGKVITIPFIPAFRPDDQADHQIAIIDYSTGCDYEFQQFDPHDLTANAEATYHAATGTGIHANDAGATGSDISLLGGLITPRDIASGSIRHALRYATPINAPTFVAPASRSDGTHVGGIPEGQLMRLDPGLDLRQFDLTPFQRMVAVALQRYGAYDADSAGAFVLYAENTIDGARYSRPISPLPRDLIAHLQFLVVKHPTAAVQPDSNHDSSCNQQHFANVRSTGPARHR